MLTVLGMVVATVIMLLRTVVLSRLRLVAMATLMSRLLSRPLTVRRGLRLVVTPPPLFLAAEGVLEGLSSGSDLLDLYL